MNEQTQQPETELNEEQLEAAAPETAESVDTSSEQPDEAQIWKDKTMRVMADLENMKRRQAKELQDARKYGVMNFAKEMLSVHDNLSRAMEEISKLNVSEDHKAVTEGIEMTLSGLNSAFEKVEIKRIDAMGEKLNPELHQAMFEVPTNDAEEGTIVQEMQAGYTISGRLLRPAMVGVAKKA